MEFNFGQPNSLEPQYGNTINLDFSNSNSLEPQYGNTINLDFSNSNSLEPQYGNTINLDFSNSNSLEPQYGNTINLDFSNSDSSVFDFSGGSPTAAMHTPHLFPPPCTSFPSVDEESLRAPPERKNRRLSKDPQSVLARLRREKVSLKMRELGRMVSGGTKMDTESMLEEACQFVRFLKRRVELLEQAGCAEVCWPVMGDDFFPGGAQL